MREAATCVSSSPASPSFPAPFEQNATFSRPWKNIATGLASIRTVRLLVAAGRVPSAKRNAGKKQKSYKVLTAPLADTAPTSCLLYPTTKQEAVTAIIFPPTLCTIQ